MARSMAVVSCVLSVAAVASACSGAPHDSAPDYQVAAAPNPSPSAPPTSPPADSPPQPGQQDTTPAPAPSGSSAPVGTPSVPYEGTLAQTALVPFGGKPACSYDVRLAGVILDVNLSDAGAFVSATAHDLMTENIVGACSTPTIPPTEQTFTSSAATAIAGGWHVTFTGASANRPATSLVIDLTSNAGTWDAAATWTRTDQKGSLNWTVKANVTLNKKM